VQSGGQCSGEAIGIGHGRPFLHGPAALGQLLRQGSIQPGQWPEVARALSENSFWIRCRP
jgi:hypothetical protein